MLWRPAWWRQPQDEKHSVGRERERAASSHPAPLLPSVRGQRSWKKRGFTLSRAFAHRRCRRCFHRWEKRRMFVALCCLFASCSACAPVWLKTNIQVFCYARMCVYCWFKWYHFVYSICIINFAFLLSGGGAFLVAKVSGPVAMGLHMQMSAA